MRKKRYVLNRRGLVGLFRKIIQAGASKAHQTALLRNAVINKIDINSPLKRTCLSHRGGGTAIFVRNSLRHHVVSFNTNTFENTTVKLELGNNIHLTLSCIYKPPRNHINTTELDAILNASPKVMLFGDFNARHPCWNPGRPNTHGNTLYDWASAHALDIMAPTAPTYFAARGTCSILDIAFAKNLTLEDINSIHDLSSDPNPVLIDLALNNSLPKNLRTLKSTNWIKFQEIVFNSIPGNPVIDTNNIDNAINNFTGMITSAISATTVTKVINTPHLRLPHHIRELIKIKNRFRKQWQLTRNPLLKREVNSLQRQIRAQISEHRNKS
ncbi:probable RNA-directed DNA polymerase from transposon X-element [Trichonephila clavipes]|nr:probable RNA-directed DNA polymerase from transposon X-element [Trichonephila clavipes]